MIGFNYGNPYSGRMVTPERMRQTRAMLDTPVKRGAVMEFPDRYTDCPSVFRYGERWIMTFIAISKDTSVSGYETHYAESDDLLSWHCRGPLLTRDETREWDSKQIAGYAALYDTAPGEGCRLTPENGRYRMTYLAGASDGYEPDPLLMGVASAEDPTDPASYTRCARPILKPDDPDARFFETRTLYKSAVVRDEERLTGYPFVMFYNAKGYDGRERIYAAVTDDPEDPLRGPPGDRRRHGGSRLPDHRRSHADAGAGRALDHELHEVHALPLGLRHLRLLLGSDPLDGMDGRAHRCPVEGRSG